MVRARNSLSVTFWVFILMTMVFLLAACGGTQEPAVQTEAAPPEEAAPAGGNAPAPAASSEAPPESCVEANPHPVGQSIAETYETATYEQVMMWFCDGNTFEDILLALETNAQTGVDVEDLLAMRAAGTTWDQIWQDIGLVEQP